MSAFGGKADMTFLGAYVPTKPYAYWGVQGGLEVTLADRIDDSLIDRPRRRVSEQFRFVV
jgi:hypothetical protein